MKNTLFILLTALVLSMGITSKAHAGCDHSWQTARDGSNCGGRAADQRPGGR